MDETDVGSTCYVEASAKLNLFLEVLGKRDDGFHEIETLMVAISIHDSLFFEATREDTIRLTCKWASGMEANQAPHGNDVVSALSALPADRDNLVWKAVDRFRQAADVALGAKIHLIKRIPAAAGLGGASSDAAAALLAANQQWRVGWSMGQLSQFAVEMGSDVPFFLGDGRHGHGMALCRGRGERIQEVRNNNLLHLVVMRPWEGLSTADVYRECRPSDSAVAVRPLLEALEQGNLCRVGRLLFNRLEPAAASLSHHVRQLRERFAQLDLPGFAMSGSGSCFFGLCRHRREARRVATLLRSLRLGLVYTATTSTLRRRIAVSPA